MIKLSKKLGHCQMIYIVLCIFIGNSDLRLLTPARTFPARSFSTQPVRFTLLRDSVVQEIDETFTLRLNYSRAPFEPNDATTFFDELSVTIVDSEGTFLLFNTILKLFVF